MNHSKASKLSSAVEALSRRIGNFDFDEEEEEPCALPPSTITTTTTKKSGPSSTKKQKITTSSSSSSGGGAASLSSSSSSSSSSSPSSGPRSVKETFAQRYAREYNCNQEDTETHLEEYLKFLSMKVVMEDRGFVAVPSTIVERVWRMHIIDTKSYHRLCALLRPGLFQYIHYDPRQLAKEVDAGRMAHYEDTRFLYAFIFEEPFTVSSVFTKVWPGKRPTPTLEDDDDADWP